MAALSRWQFIGVVSALALRAAIAAPDDLPTKNPDEPLDFEPSLRLYDVKPDPNSPVSGANPVNLEKARVKAEAAQKKERRWQDLQQKGVLSKLEAARAGVEARKAVLRFQEARVATLQQQYDSIKQRSTRGETSAALLESAESALRTAEHLAAEAKASYVAAEQQLRGPFKAGR